MKDFRDADTEMLAPVRINVASAAVTAQVWGDTAARPAPHRHQAGRTAGVYEMFGKRLLDTALVLAAVPIALPLVLICALVLWCEGGKPFYRQARVGRGGRIFYMIKLRSMVQDAETRLAQVLSSDPELRAEWEHSQKLRNDPRITRVGALLRATSLDELPQLWNVLIGEMSLVGPRPMMPEQLGLYGDPVDYFALTPGLTGVWQVSTRNDSSFAHRATIDAAYRRSLSLGQDLGLLARTVGVVMRRTGC
ncbi:sugar transferase [Sedimentitalea sp. HM32M-2]|uniref:sugar transferase n=1 Tax=Sedimentitalea sp. HM32M-2 TaxID=3351566 RepID=UPI00362D1EDE